MFAHLTSSFGGVPEANRHYGEYRLWSRMLYCLREKTTQLLTMDNLNSDQRVCSKSASTAVEAPILRHQLPIDLERLHDLLTKYQGNALTPSERGELESYSRT